MRIPFDVSDLVVIGASTVAVAVAILVVGTPPQAVSAAARFAADCPASTKHEIWHLGSRRSLQITCEGIAR